MKDSLSTMIHGVGLSLSPQMGLGLSLEILRLAILVLGSPELGFGGL